MSAVQESVVYFLLNESHVVLPKFYISWTQGEEYDRDVVAEICRGYGRSEDSVVEELTCVSWLRGL